MKMHESKPTSSRWMNENFHCVGTYGDDDEEDDDHYRNLDSVGEPAYSDVNTPGPYSVTSFPPSVGPDEDALMPTPHMYAPTSPACVTPLNFPDSGVNRPSDDLHHFSSAKKALILSDQVPILQTGSRRGSLEHGSNIFGLGDTQKCGFSRQNVNRSLSTQVYQFDISREEYVSLSRPEESDTSWGVLESSAVNIDEATDEERRMSLDEFVDCVKLEEIILNESQMTIGARKRTASIFSNPDFPDFDSEIPAKRQLLISSPNNLVSNMQDIKVNSLDSCVGGSNGAERFATVPQINFVSRRQESSLVAQNPTGITSSTSIARPPHYSLPNTGQFGQTVQEPQPSSLAASNSTICDHNGNFVRTESQPPDNHISPWFVGPNPTLNQQHTSATRNEETGLQTQHHTTTSRMLPTQPNTPTCVLRESSQDQPHLTAELTNYHPQQMIDKLPDDHTDTVRSTIVQPDSDNQNFIVHNGNMFSLQEIASNPNVLAALKIIYSPHPDVAACSGEATSAATITTSSHDLVSYNGIYQQQDLTRKSHLCHTSSDTDPLPFNTHGSDISRLHADPVTVGMFVKNSTGNTSQYQTQTFHATPSVLDNNPAIYGQDIMVSGIVDTFTINNMLTTSSTSILSYHQNDLLEEQQECNSIDQRTAHEESSPLDGLVHDSPNLWIINFPAQVSDDDDITNDIKSQPTDETWREIPAVDPADHTVSGLQAHHLPCPSHGGTATHSEVDHLTDINLHIVPDFTNTVDQSHCFEVIQENTLVDLIEEPTPSDFETSRVWESGESVLTDPDLEVQSPSTLVNIPDITDVGAARKLNEVAQKTVNVKQELKSAILTKRRKEGKAAIEISFQPVTHHELTEEEQAKEKRRKELNRKAAATHRKKKNASKKSLEQEYDEEMIRNSELKKTIAQLEDEVNTLRQLMGIITPCTRISDN